MVTELQRFPFLRKCMDEVLGNFLREGLEPSETMITHVIEMEVCWDLAYLIFLKYKCILAPPTAIMLKADAEKYSWVLRLWSLNLVAQYKPYQNNDLCLSYQSWSLWSTCLPKCCGRIEDSRMITITKIIHTRSIDYTI